MWHRPSFTRDPSTKIYDIDDKSCVLAWNTIVNRKPLTVNWEEIPGFLCTLSWGWRPGRPTAPSKPLLQLIWKCRILEQAIGCASSHLGRNAGSVSGLASSRARESGSSLCGELCKPPAKTKKIKKTKKMKKTKTNITVATWNVGTLNERGAEVVDTLSRQQVDICGLQEHWFKDT